MTLAYISYMTAEAFHLSGVVSSLFCGEWRRDDSTPSPTSPLEYQRR